MEKPIARMYTYDNVNQMQISKHRRYIYKETGFESSEPFDYNTGLEKHQKIQHVFVDANRICINNAVK